MNNVWEERPEGLSDQQLIAWALSEVASAIHKHYYQMGTGNAATPMGATEVLGQGIMTGCDVIAESIDAVATHLGALAAQRELSD